MGKAQNRQQRRAAERDEKAYGFAKLAALKIAPKPKPRRKLSLTLVVSIIIGVLLAGAAYVVYASGGHSAAPVVRIGGPAGPVTSHPQR